MADVNVRITATDKASAQINAVGKSLSGLSNQVSSVQNAVNSLATGGIPGLTKSLSTLSGVVSGSIPVWAGLGGIVGAVGGALIGFMTSSANAAEQLQNMSAITGLATDKLEGLQRIAEDAGLQTDTLASGIGKLNRQLASGEGGDFTKVLSAMGGSIKDSNGEVKDAITLLDEMGDMLRGVESDTLRSQLANAAFGKSLQFLIPLITGSTEKLSDQIAKMKENGRIMDEITTQRMLKWDKALDEFKADWDRLTTAIKSNTGALIDWINTSALAEELRSQIRREGGAGGGWGAGAGTGASGSWGPAGKSPLEIQAEQEARAAGIASGKKGQELELTLKIADAERRMKEVHGDKQIAIAKEIAGYKQQLEAIAANKKLSEEMYDLNRKAVELAYNEWVKQDAARKKLEEERYDLNRKAADQEFSEFEKRDAARKKLEDERYELNRKAAEEAFDAWDKADKKRLEDLEKYNNIFVKLNDQRDRATEENRRQWERMLDKIKDGAGEIFDAMLTKGQNVFASLANYAQGVLQTMLRNIFQNAVAGIFAASGAGLSKLFNAGGGGATGGGGGAGSAAMGFAGLGIPFLGKLGGSQGAQLQQRLNPGGRLGGFAGFAGSRAGQAVTGAGMAIGSMLAMDAFKRGSAFEGMAGGAIAGASIGTMIAPGVGTAIGAGVGAIAGLITGLFGGGAQRRAEEAAKRAAAQEAQKFAAPEAITRYGIAGGAGYTVETGLTGDLRGIGTAPTVITNVNVQMIDARSAEAAGNIIADTVSKRILTGGTYLADNVAWAAS